MTLAGPASASGNAGAAIGLRESAPGFSTQIRSRSIISYIDAIPAGVVIASGGKQLHGSRANSSVNILGWNLATLTVTAPAASSADFVLTLRSRSREGTSTSAEATRNISVAINGAPTAVGFTAQAFNENVVGIAVGGTVVGTLSATDPDGGTFTYTITGGAQASKFRIEGTTLYLANGQWLDYEAGNALVDIRATDSGGMSFTRTGITIRPANLNEAPPTPGSSSSTVSFAENATGDTGVRFSATDPDGDAVSFRFSNGTTSSGNFSIVNGNQLWVSIGLNFEAATSHSFNIYAQANGQTSANALSQTVNVTGAPEGPSTPTTTNGNVTFSENQTGDTLVRFSSTDPEGDAITYYFGATGTQTYGNFQIIGNALHVVSPLNFESPPAILSFSVYASSPGFTSPSGSLQTVTIGPVDEAPNAPTAIGPYSITENANFSVTLSGLVDPEAADVDYSFAMPLGVSGNPGLLFEILNGATNSATLRILNNGTLDFDTLKNQSYYTAIDANSGYVTIKVVATDVDVTNPNTNFADARKSAVRDIRLNVSNLNDNAPSTPGIAAWGTTTFNENSGAGAVVATLTASDPDGSLNALSYELTSNPGGMFQIVGNQIRVVAGSNFNYEAFASGGTSTLLSVGVRTTDGTNPSASAYSFNVQVNNLDDLLPAAGGVVMQNGYSTTILEKYGHPASGAGDRARFGLRRRRRRHHLFDRRRQCGQHLLDRFVGLYRGARRHRLRGDRRRIDAGRRRPGPDQPGHSRGPDQQRIALRRSDADADHHRLGRVQHHL